MKKMSSQKMKKVLSLYLSLLIFYAYCFKIIEILKIGKDTSIQGVPEKIYVCEKGSLNINGLVHIFTHWEDRGFR